MVWSVFRAEPAVRLVLGFASVGWGVTPAAASVLAEVLAQIDAMGGSPLAAVMTNLAENIAVPVQGFRDLRPNDKVIVGYDGAGAPVVLQADEAGVFLSPEVASTLSSGLRAGLYPAGSLLFSLPPAGQLSLYEESRDGAELAHARELLMSKIDGSITNIILSAAPPELAPAQLASVYLARHTDDLFDLGSIRSTALGAVNTGEIVTNVSAAVVSGAVVPQINMRLAEVSSGTNISLDEAVSGTTSSLHSVTEELGGAASEKALVLNQATNGSMVTAHVLTIVRQQNANIAEITTTAIGAVNAGSVNPLLSASTAN